MFFLFQLFSLKVENIKGRLIEVLFLYYLKLKELTLLVFLSSVTF